MTGEELAFIPHPSALIPQMDMAQQLQLDVVTPERRVLSEAVDTTTIPGLNGELGILPGHTPLISQIKTGVLSYTAEGYAWLRQHRLEQADRGIANRELRSVDSDSNASGPCVAVVACQRPLAPLVEAAGFGQRERMRGNDDPSKERFAQRREVPNLRIGHP